MTERGKLADAALEYLRDQHRKGHEGFIRECLAAALPEAADKFRRQVLERTEVVVPTLDAESTPGWLQSARDDVKKLKPPGWITPGDLPPIVVGGHKLNDEQSKAVLASLSQEQRSAGSTAGRRPQGPRRSPPRWMPSPGHSSSVGSSKALRPKKSGP